MTNKDFEKGVEFGTKWRSMFFHYFLGIGCLLFGVLWFLLNQDKSKIWWQSILLIVFGSLSLYLAIAERKELKTLRG